MSELKQISFKELKSGQKIAGHLLSVQGIEVFVSIEKTDKKNKTVFATVKSIKQGELPDLQPCFFLQTNLDPKEVSEGISYPLERKALVK